MNCCLHCGPTLTVLYPPTMALSLAVSDCAFDVDVEVGLEDEIKDCYNVYNMMTSLASRKARKEGTKVTLETKCLYVENLRKCFIDAAPYACHNDMTAFIKDVWTHAASKQFEGLGCDSKASPQQSDLRLSGPPSGQDAGGGARTRDRGVPANLRADSLATVPPTPPASHTVTKKFIVFIFRNISCTAVSLLFQ
ncbi:hypothetical protein PoB_000035000 [Plakobranchus ocellatus]|uniref:DUF19 domain-containing protein n=1 Tax=Plakobranchus ocellatus TaxID=259542 RepID=A0AAV3XSE1_9GAST|nr:hypothetical protein PoB_000035000 [Plakobranchus ocellatus]